MDAMSTPGPDWTSKAATTGGAKALAKGLVLVDVVAHSQGPVRLSDLVETSGLPRPTVIRLLDALLEAGALRSEASGGYALGPRLLVWGQAYLNALNLPQQAQQPMHALVEESRETCFLGVRDGSHLLYVATVESPMAVRPEATVGSLNPLHSTAMGKGAPRVRGSWAHRQHRPPRHGHPPRRRIRTTACCGRRTTPGPGKCPVSRHAEHRP